MIRECTESDLPAMFEIVNDAAQAYKGVIPADCWHEPYMPMAELEGEIRDGVQFFGYEDGGELVGVMGIQDRGEVALMRHAYVRTTRRSQGIGTQLFKRLDASTTKPILLGTWAAATWAIRLYEKHGYRLLPREQANHLLRKYWNIPDRQLDTSVVMANPRWR